MLLFSRQGKLRLQKWFTAQSEKAKKKMARELIGMILQRKPKMCSFLEFKDLKIVYKRYDYLAQCNRCNRGLDFRILIRLNYTSNANVNNCCQSKMLDTSTEFFHSIMFQVCQPVLLLRRGAVRQRVGSAGDHPQVSKIIMLIGTSLMLSHVCLACNR